MSEPTRDDEEAGYPPHEFTPVETKMLAVLSDGMPHGKEELHECLWDREGTVDNIRMHISNMRKKLERHGHTIVCVTLWRKAFYRHVRLLRRN